MHKSILLKSGGRTFSDDKTPCYIYCNREFCLPGYRHRHETHNPPLSPKFAPNR